MKTVDLFTDGACSGNPGPGGWGVLLRYKKVEKQAAGGENPTTNNRMEMTAVIKGLEMLKEPCHIRLHTDSQYVLKGYTEWMPGWIKRGWKNSAKQPVANVDLWQQIVDLAKPHRIDWIWVRGHNGHPENELVDELAQAQAQMQVVLLNNGL